MVFLSLYSARDKEEFLDKLGFSARENPNLRSRARSALRRAQGRETA